MTSKSTRTKQLTGANTGGGSVITAGTGIAVAKSGTNNTISTSGLGSFLVAPTWKSLANFDGTNILSLNVSDVGGAWQISQASRIKFGNAYLVSLRGLVSKTGNFAPTNHVFTLPAGWQPPKNLAFATVFHTVGELNGDTVRVDVESSGTVKVHTTTLYVSLDGISFWTA